MSFIGLDFGTTNSTLAISDAAGAVKLVDYEVRGKRYDTFRSVLYFEPEAKTAICGIEGIFAYLDSGSHGRFVQSVKSYLASKSFRSTNINHRVFTLEQLIAQIVTQLKAKAKSELPESVVVGRPVHFVNDDDDADGDAYAEGRLRAAMELAGFKRIELVYEPVAAAYEYTRKAGDEELLLVADFGGGTTDLCLMQKSKVLATSGVALAGDAFDQRIIQHAVAPKLGMGTKYGVFGGEADVPLWLYSSLARWHLLSFLKSPKTMQTLDTIVAKAKDKPALETLRRIIEDDLGYTLHQAVERVKIALSTQDEATLDFDAGTISAHITRDDFAKWIAPDVQKIAGAIDEVLKKANVTAVDRVFLTGGTSLVPAVRELFASRFGDDKLRGGEEMTSVGRGLGLVARDTFR